MVCSVSLLPPHTHAKKNFPYGTEVIHFCVSVCLCVCMSVCLSVCVSPLQSQITFGMFVGWETNFQSLLNSSQVIFGRVTRTPGPSLRGQARTPKKGVSAKSISSGGLGAQ